jgi:hypothetical protein
MGLCFLAPLFADIISNFSIRSSQYEVTSELQIKALLSLHVTQHISFTHHTASSVLTTKTSLGHSHDVSCPGLYTKLTWSLWSLSSEFFYPGCQEILQSEFICRSRKLSSLAEPWGHHNHAAGHVSPGKGWDLVEMCPKENQHCLAWQLTWERTILIPRQ